MTAPHAVNRGGGGPLKPGFVWFEWASRPVVRDAESNYVSTAPFRAAGAPP